MQALDFNGFHVLRRPSAAPAATVHFAHATGFNATTYRALFESLNAKIDLHAADARGHGLSTVPADPRKLRSWRRFATDLLAYVETLDGPVVLAGHSMGATVSLQVAALRPDLVRALVLIDPVMVPPKSRWIATVARALGLSARIPIAVGASKRTMTFESRQAAVENYSGKGAFKSWPRSWIEAYVEGGTRTSEDGVTLSCHRDWEARTFATATTDPFSSVKRLTVPTTLLTAGPRSTCDPDCVRAFLKHQPNTRHIALPEASHFIPMERTRLVQEELERAAGVRAS